VKSLKQTSWCFNFILYCHSDEYLLYGNLINSMWFTRKEKNDWFLMLAQHENCRVKLNNTISLMFTFLANNLKFMWKPSYLCESESINLHFLLFVFIIQIFPYYIINLHKKTKTTQTGVYNYIQLVLDWNRYKHKI
jgi:hypothetical protein